MEKDCSRYFKLFDTSKNRLLGTGFWCYHLDNWKTFRPFQWTESEFPELFLVKKQTTNLRSSEMKINYTKTEWTNEGWL